MNALLSVEALTVRYGGALAVNDVSFDVEPGSFVGLIGPNGAGKTSLIDAVTGFTPSTGSVAFDGKAIQSMKPYRRARSGLARTFQSVELFDDLTALENLALAWRGGPSLAQRRSNASQEARAQLGTLGLEHLADRPAEHLSFGERKYVALARALVARPRMVLLDEPAAGLDSRESAALGAVLSRLAADGLTILLIDHDMSLVLRVCEVIHVLDFGRLIAAGGPDQISSDPLVISAYLGSVHVAGAPIQ
jgi:ABC-type branched-subunit amino acid transport system ATPase component